MGLLKIVVPCIAKRNVWSTSEENNTKVILCLGLLSNARRINWSLLTINSLSKLACAKYSCIAGYCYCLKTAYGTFILSLGNTVDNHCIECVKGSSGGHLCHEKVMSQDLYRCWKTITTGMYILLRDSNKIILLCLIEVRGL